MLTGVESFAGHLEQRVQRASLAGRPLPVMPALGAVLLRRFPLELLLLLLLLQHGMMQAWMHAVMHTVVMMAQRIGAAGIGDGTPSGRGRAAERRLADRASRHRCQGHAHQGQIPGRRGMIVVVVVKVVVLLLLLLLLLEAVMMVVEMVVRLDRVPRAHDLRLRPVRQDVQYAERLHPPLVRVPIPLVLLVRVLHHLHHLQTFQRFEVIVRGRRTAAVAARPAVHLLLVLLVLLLVPQRGHGIATATLVDPPAVRHPVIATARVTVLVVDHRLPRVASSGAQSVHVLVPPLGQPLVLLRAGRDDHEGQRARAAHGDLVLVVLNVASAGRPSVDRRRSQAAGRRGARGHRGRR